MHGALPPLCLEPLVAATRRAFSGWYGCWLRCYLAGSSGPQEHKHAIALFEHFKGAAAQGNSHAMDLLAAALAVDLRLSIAVSPSVYARE
jgi:hypothetical protein